MKQVAVRGYPGIYRIPTTFSAGLSPPGGIYQDGDSAGRPIMGGTKLFKVFKVSNDIALFTSLGIVVVLVSVIPIRHRALTRLLAVTDRVMWISVSFMVLAYTTGSWMTWSSNKGSRLTLEVSYALGLGTLGSVFIALLVLITRKWVSKPKQDGSQKEQEQDGSQKEWVSKPEGGESETERFLASQDSYHMRNGYVIH